MSTARNPLALEAIRSILAAAMPFEIHVDGTALKLNPEPAAQPVWPREIPGLDASQHGPWPRPVEVRCTWGGGSVRLRLEPGYWSVSGKWRGYLGLRAVEAQSGQPIVWITVTNKLEDTRGQIARVLGAYGITHRTRDGDLPHAPMTNQLRRLVATSGLPLVSEANIEAFQLQTANGAVLPSPSEAFRRIVHLSVLKLPFMLRDRPGAIGGTPFITVLAAPSEAMAASATQPRDLTPPVPPTGIARLGVWPLPGGVRQYKQTFDDLLAWFAQNPRSREDLATHLLARYEVRGLTTIAGYERLLTSTGFVTQVGEDLMATEAGLAYLADRSPLTLFETLHQEFQGFLATLVIADSPGGATTQRTTLALNALLHTNWESQNQASFRRNWLLSLGLTERTPNGDEVTDLGRQALHVHGEAAQAYRDELASLLPELGADEPAPEEDIATDGAERGPSAEVPGTRPAVASGAPGWEAHRLDLHPEMVIPFARDLLLPTTFFAQACAALSAGKHLLLVGPPGTGKTRVAQALCEAAAAEGYCVGALSTTASADWTTFETIGGYTLQRDQSLCFRPGVFLRSLTERRWLVVDELNRADVDRAFGELMTVLSGTGAETPFLDDAGRPVSVGPESGRSHRVPSCFRVIATMNTWDKTSLFRLSYAAQRRFAILHVGPPRAVEYEALLRDLCTREGVDPPLEVAATDIVTRLFSPEGILGLRPIGPAVPLDIIRYMRRRQAGGDALGEAAALFLLPQLEGLGDEAARRSLIALDAALKGWASEGAAAEVRARLLELFPHVSFPDE